MFYSDPFDFFGPFHSRLSQPRVFIVSDSDYKKYQQEKAEAEVTRLESKLNRYNTAIEEIKVEIDQIKENAGLLPAAKTEEAAAAA